MWFRTLFDALKPSGSRTPVQKARRGVCHGRPAPCRLSLEALEDRLAPASFMAGHALHVERDSSTHHLAVVGNHAEPRTMTVLSAAPVLSISGVNFPEGNSGQTGFVFSVNLSKPSSNRVSVNFATTDGTATVADYVRTAGSLTFAPGETAKTVTVLVKGDTVVEPDETFFVKLSSARNASIANATGVGTILNDDVAVAAPVAVNDSNATDLSTPVSGNVLANDTNPLAGALTVSTVNGRATNVGTPITLASGAQLTLNANGTYTYNPNGSGSIFRYLDAWQTGTDSFTYTAANALGTQSNTATVTITITHVIPVQPGDPGDMCSPDNPYYPNC